MLERDQPVRHNATLSVWTSPLSSGVVKHVVQKVINAFLILTLTMFILNGVIVRPMVNGGVGRSSKI